MSWGWLFSFYKVGHQVATSLYTWTKQGTNSYMTPKDASSPVCPSECPYCCLNMDFASRWKDRRLNGVLAQSQRVTLYLAISPTRLWVSGRQDCFSWPLQHHCLARCLAHNKRLGTWVTVDRTAENNFAIFVLHKNTWGTLSIYGFVLLSQNGDDQFSSAN